MTQIEKLIAQKDALDKRIAEARANQKKRARQKVMKLLETHGLFTLPAEVLAREFEAIAIKNLPVKLNESEA